MEQLLVDFLQSDVNISDQVPPLHGNLQITKFPENCK
jgi:hypothetical protein